MARFEAARIPFCFALIRFENRARKPGPAFNVAMASAFADGADYLYRSNDDTAPATKFASKFAAKLATFSPPNVGVVAPYAAQVSTALSDSNSDGV